MVVQSERIYSSQQLVQAMRSGVSGIRDQLQVLCVLDGTASSWPGVNQAVSDFDFLVDMAAAQAAETEDKLYRAECRATDAEREMFTMKETVALANQGIEGLKKQLAAEKAENSQLTKKMDQAKLESIQQKQELWALEKQRADLASEAEKYKQDSEYMEGEIRTLRVTNTEQATALATLKEEVSARNADVLHLKQQTIEQRRELEVVRKKLENKLSELRTLQGALEGVRTEKNKFEQESIRLKETINQLKSQLAAATAENQRRKDMDTLQTMVAADKSKEEEAARIRTHQEAVARATHLDKRLAIVSSDLSNREERLRQKTSEAAGLSKQVQLLNINNKELQKQVAELNASKRSLEASADDLKKQISELQTELQALQCRQVGFDKDKSMSESRMREAFASERARLQAAADEQKRESVVQRTLAASYSRDIKELQAKLRTEQETVASLREQLETVTKAEDSKKYESFMAGTLAETVNKDLKAQLEKKEEEMKRMRADTMSMQRRLEKQLESLQRECNESAAEVQRLRRGDGLPLLAHPRTIHDELSSLKRLVSSMPGPDQLSPAEHGAPISAGGSFPRLAPVVRSSGSPNSLMGSRQRSS